MSFEVLTCHCRLCRNEIMPTIMVICPVCGDKRCPHADDHRVRCTNPTRSPEGYEANRKREAQ